MASIQYMFNYTVNIWEDSSSVVWQFWKNLVAQI